MERPCILIVTPIYPPQIGGPASYTHDLAHQLVKQGYLVKVLTFGDSAVESTPQLEVISMPIQGNFISRQYLLARTALKLIPNIKSIYIQGTLTVGITTVLLAKIFHITSLVKFVGDEVWENYQKDKVSFPNLETFFEKQTSLQIKSMLLLEKIVLSFANHIVTPSEYLADLIHTHFHIPKKKIHQINNPVEIKEIEKKQTSQLVFVGRLVSWKNVNEILEAFSQINESTDYNLNIVGEGPEKMSLISLSKSLGIENKVHFLGRKNKKEVTQLLTDSKALLLYSDYEGQPHVILEAMITKTWVIASEIKPHTELSYLLHVRLCKPHDPNLLAKTILDLPQKSPHIDNNFLKTFSWQYHLDKLHTLGI